MRLGGILSAVLIGTAIVIAQPVATALTPQEVADIAQQITVRIDGANTGSGVIIERQGNVYTVVTNWHVVQLQGNYTVYTPDNKKYTFNNSQVKRFPGVDLAVFQFTSNENYRVAEKGNSDQVKLGTNISVAGYPQGTTDIDFRRGAISRLVTKPKDGYAFVYDIGGFPGMSGGAILDEQGKLVGIHGRATTRPDTNATTVLGIPLKTYLSFVPSKSPVATTPPKPQNPSVSNLPQTTNLQRVNSNNNQKRSNYTRFTLLKTLQGNFNSVFSVSLSPDGKTLASGSWSRNITLWNVATGKEVGLLQGHSDFVHSVAYSPDGKILASSSADKTIKLWNMATGKEIYTLQSRGLTSIAFSPDATILTSTDDDANIKLWNVATGRGIRILQGHSSWVDGYPNLVESLAFSPDGKTLASGSRDKTIKLWNVSTAKEIRTLQGHSQSIQSLAYSPDGKILASGSDDRTIKLWDVATGREIRTIQGHSQSVPSLAYSPGGKILASGSRDKTIKLWDIATGREVQTLQGQGSIVSVESVVFSANGKFLVSGNADGTIQVWGSPE